MFVILFALLPLCNFLCSPKEYRGKKLFNTDILEGYFNYAIYKFFNKSASPISVIIGTHGFTFMSKQYKERFHDPESYHKAVTLNDFINTLSKLQKEYEKKRINFIYVIGSNKTSIYKDMFPKWYNNTNDKTSTDKVVHQLYLKNIKLLDLRQILYSHRKEDKLLHYKNDHHWNELGSSIGVECTLDYLNQLYNLNIKKPYYTITSNFAPGKYNKDEVKLLKIRDFINDEEEQFFNIELKQGCKIKFCNFNKDNSTFNDCKLEDNLKSNLFTQSRYTYNECALNNKKLFVIGDSFFDATSTLNQASFKEIWQLYFYDFQGPKLQNLIEKIKPDIIIRQNIERYWPEEIKF